MSMTLEELKVVIDAEIAPFKKKMQEAAEQTRKATSAVQKQTSSIKSTFSKLAAFAGFAVLGKKLLDLGMYSTQMALEVSAAINQIKRQMGESSQSFLKWINDNANAMNMSVGEATKYAGVYSNLFSTFIKDSDKLSAYTGKMLQTSAVVAEGTGRTMTDVMERIRSGLLGNTEAIEDLGIQVGVSMIQSTNAFKKFSDGKSWDQLDFLTQQQIRLMAILEQATQKYGDTLASTVNGRVNLFKSLLKDAALNIGNSFLPILNAVMPVLNSLAMALKNVTAKLAEFVGLMFNKKATVKDGAIGSANKGMKDLAGGAGDVADALGDADDASGGLADNLDDTAKSAKKAVKELLGLAGFDEINALKKNDDSDSDAKSPKGGKGKKGKDKGGGGFKDILPEIGLEDMNNNFKSIFDGWGDKLKGLLSLFTAGFNAAFRAEGLERIQKALNRIKKTLTEIATDPQVVNAFNLMTQRIAYALGQVVGSIATVGVAIGVFVAESIANGLERQKGRIKQALVALFTNIGEIAQSIGNIAQSLSNAFYDVMTSIGAIRIGSAIVSTVLSAGSTIVELGSNLARDWFKGFEKIITDNAPKLAKTLKATFNNIAPVFETIERAINDFGDMWTRVYREHVRPVYDDVSEGLSKIVGIFIDGFNSNINPIIKQFGDGFKKVYDEHIKPAIDKIGESLGGMYDAFKKLWDKVLQPLFEWIAANVWPILAPIIEKLGDDFLNTLGLIFDIIGQLFEILRGVIDFIVGVFTGDWDLAWQGVLEILHGLFGPIADWFSEKFKSAYNGIVNAFSNIGQWFSERYNDIKNALQSVGTWFTQKFQQAWNGLTNVFSGLGSWFGQQWSDVTSALSNVANWFGNIFRQAFYAVQNAFSSIGSFFSGVWNTVQNIFVNAGQMVGSAVGGAFRGAVNAVLGTIENIVNGFIDMINDVIGIINQLPGVSIGYIGGVYLPRLARGGIVDSPTVAMIGEAGKEAVVPLENTGFLQTMGRVVGSAVVNALGDSLPQNQGFSGNGDIVFIIGGHEFGRIAIQEINKEQERAGQVLLNI
jgi:phage-related protein